MTQSISVSCDVKRQNMLMGFNALKLVWNIDTNGAAQQHTAKTGNNGNYFLVNLKCIHLLQTSFADSSPTMLYQD